MKKYLYHFMLVAAVALLALVSSCADNLQPSPVEQGDTYSFSVKATKSDALTKSLTASVQGTGMKHDITSTWDEGEVVTVYQGDEKVGELVAQTGGGVTTTLKGDIKKTFDIDVDLTLKAREKPDYTAQDGTLATIATNCDYQVATVKVKEIDGNNAIAESNSVSFISQQAIVSFHLMKAHQVPINPTSFSIQYGNKTDGYKTINIDNIDFETVNAANIASGYVGGLFVVALPGFEGDVTLEATDKNSTGTWHYKADATFENGKSYSPRVYLYHDLYTALTFEAKEDGTVVTFTAGSDLSGDYLNGIEYSVMQDLFWGDWGAYQPYTSGTEINLTHAGWKVRFRGSRSSCAKSSLDSESWTFSCTKPCYVYGNVMSLVKGSAFQYQNEITGGEFDSISETIPGNYAFANLFENNDKIYNHPFKPLVLPATTLKKACYYQMFAGCTNLTAAPVLPAPNLPDFCYYFMFDGCSNLVTAPSTIAAQNGSLGSECCYAMFRNCIKLTSAPSLPATSLNSSCYTSLFEGCSELASAPALPAGTMKSCCYLNMFKGCKKLSTPPTLASTALASQCYQGMFEGCEGLTEAPDLPATKMESTCYCSMFEGCTLLKVAPNLGHVTTVAGSCFSEMFRNCSGLTTAPTMPNVGTAPTYCYNQMFYGCANLDTNIPTILPATSLENNCYYGMFQGCSKITTAPILPALVIQQYSYAYMFYGCSSLTSVTCRARTLNYWYALYNWLTGTNPGTLFVNNEYWGTDLEAAKTAWSDYSNGWNVTFEPATNN